jgi:hypothetical protein
MAGKAAGRRTHVGGRRRVGIERSEQLVLQAVSRAVIVKASQGVAVRQLSIADITFNWPRLTWPALAWRHAGPWSRKISATSNLERDTRAAR